MSGFTAHNIRLDDGALTIPTQALTLEEQPGFQAALRALRLAFGGELAGRRIADLGCLEGGYACGFARAGMQALGIEVRESNYANCLQVKRGVDLPQLEFVRDSALNLGRYGPFDAIFCGGLLYHMERPRAFIRLMAENGRKALLLNTHYATAEPQPNYPLSDLVRHEGVMGRWYEDRPEGIGREELEALNWSSFENTKSFWIQREFLIQEIHRAGFDFVGEQYDLLAPAIARSMLEGYQKRHSRGLFLGIRT